MEPEPYPNSLELDAQCKRIREHIAPDLELPKAQRTRQSGPFRSTQHFFDSSFQNFKELLYYTNLTPNQRVLDYGCGLGRLAIPMSAYLDTNSGSYCGVDTNATCIRRNQRAFSRYKNFRFEHTNIYSKMYNSEGGNIEELLKLYLGKPFNLAFLFSVFTHILPKDCDFLLEFLRSQLVTKGEVFSSWFLINDETQKRIDAGLSRKKFIHQHHDVRIENPEVPEGAVAYYEQDVLERFKKAGFSDVRIHYGTWRGGINSWVNQDIIVARRLSWWKRARPFHLSV